MMPVIPIPEPTPLTITVTAIYHYLEDDPKCESDYASIELLIGDDLVASFGDSYHDKGSYQVRGWIDCMKFLYGKQTIKVVEEKVADF